MLYNLVLGIHIFGACATGLYALYCTYVLCRDATENYRHCAIVLAALASFEILTGTLLAVLSIQLSAAAVCNRILVYLFAVSIIEVLLYARMKSKAAPFPLKIIVAPIAASLMLLLGAIAYGF